MGTAKSRAWRNNWMPIGLLIVPVLLTGCASLTTLPGGQSSAMTAADNSLRTHLDIIPVPLRAHLAYRSVGVCNYTQSRTVYGGGTTHDQVQVRVKRIRQRYLVTETENGKVSTALIGARGELFNFNNIGSEGHHWTQKNYMTRSEQLLEKFNTDHDTKISKVHVVNDFSVLLPYYSLYSANPGDPVAVVSDETGAEWATYKYRGLTHLAGTTAAVLDLTRVLPDNPQFGPILVGFDVVDLKTMLPLIAVLDAGTKVRLERISCSP